MFPRRFAHNEHLTQVRLSGYVALEAVVIAALLLAHLTVPSKPLQTFRLHRISEVFTA